MHDLHEETLAMVLVLLVVLVLVLDVDAVEDLEDKILWGCQRGKPQRSLAHLLVSHLYSKG
jgi:hypothetical protein